jgi:DNA-binding MarR family transcriptional regulator
MEGKRPPLIKLINNLYRYTQAYNDETLKKFQLSSGTYPFLLILYEKEGISQNEISRELNVDKAMSARAVKKLIDLEYIKKHKDSNDCRACRLFLTDKAKAIIPQLIKEINNWVSLISQGSSGKDYEHAINFLNKALENAKIYRKNIEEGREEVWKE